MRALRNILADFIFQFGISGSLAARLACVAEYYWRYGVRRLEGLERGESRVQALWAMTARGVREKLVNVNWPAGMAMRCDVFTAAFMIDEFVRNPMYEQVPGFVPQPGQTVVDVGAHQGCFTLSTAARVGRAGKVVAIEALPSNFRLLKANVEGNHLGQVTLRELGAADGPGEAQFHVFREVTGGSLIMKPAGSSPIKVRRDTLDSILAGAGVDRVDLIKIDVEGAALMVLRGAARILSSRPRLVMEVEGGEAELEKVRAHLSARGYRTRTFGSILYADADPSHPAPSDP